MRGCAVAAVEGMNRRQLPWPASSRAAREAACALSPAQREGRKSAAYCADQNRARRDVHGERQQRGIEQERDDAVQPARCGGSIFDETVTSETCAHMPMVKAK